MERVICLILGYVFGLFQTSYFYGKLKGIDIRNYGSGNSGSTNTLRVMGKKAGAIVLVCDVLKAVLACTLTRILFKNSPDMVPLLVLYTGLGVVLGHNFPFYMNFRGGKGVAATGGVIIALFNFKIFIICLAVLVGTVLITRYVSLGSILGMIAFLMTWTLSISNNEIVIGHDYALESCLVVFFFTALGIFRHRENILRLMTGTENKLGQKK